MLLIKLFAERHRIPTIRIMYKITLLIAGVLLAPTALGFGREPLASTSGRDELANKMILQEAASNGYSGDSIKLDFEVPTSAVMRLYLITSGKLKLVQSTRPTRPSTSFELGYMFRPAKAGGREVSFIFDDHVVRTKAIGTHLPNEQAEPHRIPKKLFNQVNSMGSARAKGETMVFHTTDGAMLERPASLNAAAAQIKEGYIITATLNQNSEQDGAGQPATRSGSK